MQKALCYRDEECYPGKLSDGLRRSKHVKIKLGPLNSPSMKYKFCLQAGRMKAPYAQGRLKVHQIITTWHKKYHKKIFLNDGLQLQALLEYFKGSKNYIIVISSSK